jgi:hypothetical protein
MDRSCSTMSSMSTVLALRKILSNNVRSNSHAHCHDIYMSKSWQFLFLLAFIFTLILLDPGFSMA